MRIAKFAFYICTLLISVTCLPVTSVADDKGEYKAVTIKELLSDMISYDGQKVLVKGKYVIFGASGGHPACIQMGTGENPTILDVYQRYRHYWGIADQDGEISVVTHDNGVEINTKPNYEEGQEIELKGIVRYVTIASDCDRDVRYKSIYFRVNPKDVDVDLKPFAKP